MAENTMALLNYLSSPASPLPSLTTGYTPPTTVYFSYFGHFFIYSFNTAMRLYALLLIASVVFVKLTSGKNVWQEQAKGAAFVLGSIAGAVIVPNIVAALMQSMGKGMSWFSREYSPLALYGPAALLGM
jgi:hypothetical protein